ncbi:MAG: rhodanese-like domain-containing protein, partial [Eggerthellaceae bacterium]|nr:rhodanese-like domain-containing protein [Eggerthellaceae bacterium]
MNRFGKKAAVVFAVAFVAFAAVLAGCAEEGSSGKADAAGDYRRVSQAEAAEMMEKETGYLILDVRTEEEFAQGHIPGAVNVPVETIGNEPPTQLPDK